MNIIALIPARSGSKRIPGKNIKKFKLHPSRLIYTHPLIAYTIAAAKESGIFERIIVSTDSPEIADVALRYGAEVPFLRPKRYAEDLSPDYDWIKHLITELFPDFTCFANLRPTNPFRSANMIRKAWKKFKNYPSCNSLRAVERVKQHPYKMWKVIRKGVPFVASAVWKKHKDHEDLYNMPTQQLNPFYIQNGSLEMAWVRNLWRFKNVSGNRIIAFNTTGTYEGFDINTMEDWWLAEVLINMGLAKLPEVR